jgi:hypothetical protein
MLKKIASVTALSGLIGAGSAGVAAASTPSTAEVQTPAASSTFTCAKAPAAEARIAKIDARIASALPKLESAEAAATGAGNPTRTQRLEQIITRVDALQSRVSTIQSRIETKCGARVLGDHGPGELTISHGPEKTAPGGRG